MSDLPRRTTLPSNLRTARSELQLRSWVRHLAIVGGVQSVVSPRVREEDSMHPRLQSGASGRSLNLTVRLRVARTAIALTTLLLLQSPQALGASNCSDPSPGDLTTWVHSMIRQ